MTEETHVEDEDKHMTVGELIGHLQKFPAESPVLILAQMPIDPDDEDNKGKTDEELHDEATVEMPIEGIEEIEYEDDSAPKAVGLLVDIASFIDDEEDDDEELVDNDED